MNHYNLISKLKKYPKQSFPGGVDNDPDTVYNNPGSTSIPASRDQETVGEQLPSRSPLSDTPLGDTGDRRISNITVPTDSKNLNAISVKNYNKEIKNKQIKDQNKKINISKQKHIPPSIIEPIPSAVDQKIIREYNSKGIYFKSNMNAINKRDNSGNITLIIKDTNG